jgi:hypothetical protein
MNTALNARMPGAGIEQLLQTNWSGALEKKIAPNPELPSTMADFKTPIGEAYPRIAIRRAAISASPMDTRIASVGKPRRSSARAPVPI